MIRTVTLNPALDKTATAPGLTLDAVNRISGLRVDPGGKGVNVSKVVRALGGTSVACVLLAGSAGRALEGLLRDQGIEVDAFWSKGGETRSNLKLIDPTAGTHTDVNEPGPLPEEGLLSHMLEHFVDGVRPGDVVVLAGSLPRGVATGCYAGWVRACKSAGATVFLDADGERLTRGIEAGPDFVKPNDAELAELVGRALPDEDAVLDAARELQGRGVARVMVSLGGDGAIYLGGDGAWRASSPKVPVGSTVGAGDSVVAALALAEERGLGLEDALRLAMATGAANVMQSGTQAAPRELVESLLGEVEVRRI